MTNNNFKTIINSMRSNNVVIDSHDGSEMPIVGLVEFNNQSKGLAACLDARYYSLNAIYLNDNDERLHLSQMSIGGVLWGVPTSEKLKKYNDDAIFDGGKIKVVHMADGREIYPLV